MALTLNQLITQGGPAIQAASKVIMDPALPEVTCNVLRLNRVVEGGGAGPACARVRYTTAQKKQGVGLYMAVTPLRLATWARANPALAIMAGMGVVGGLVGLGYMLGKKKR